MLVIKINQFCQEIVNIKKRLFKNFYFKISTIFYFQWSEYLDFFLQALLVGIYKC